ncbi:MAG: toll/interleukin-1 receptor domain-containing protein [Chloroflexi bacterium]|nr:toll/interleukin-1 receptor domain-containing protein [Chloroflexota bacterium]
MAASRYETKLREKISRHFNTDELRTLCVDLGVNYDDLPGRNISGKARELVGFCARHGRLPEITALCRQKVPRVNWPARLFIGYNSRAEQDSALAAYLHEFLAEQGHHTFIDKGMRAGTNWLDELDWQIKTADFLLVILSKDSGDSEMVQQEVQRAYDYRKQRGYPQILPVRLAYEGMLPYSIDAYVNSTQYTVWESEADNVGLGEEILAAIDGRLPHRPSIQIDTTQAEIILSEDGSAVSDSTVSAPLSEFDPRELVVPGGAVTWRDKLYVKRDSDVQLENEISKWGATITIRAPRQTGKTSLLMRGIRHASQNKAQVVFFDFQGLGKEQLASSDIFLHELASSICHELRLDTADLEKVWSRSLGAQNKLTYFLEDHILPAFDVPIVLAIDEADSLLQSEFHKDFFGLLRSWHNRRARYEAWEKLNIVLVISTEPYLLIDDLDQSPFNVGLRLDLADFTEAQVHDLNRRHGSPVPTRHIPDLMKLLNGHPYLTRKFFYALLTEKRNLMDVVASDDGPFGDHLRRLHWALHDQPELRAALKQIIRNGRCHNQTALHRLLRAGLVKGSGDAYACRCNLYQYYFESKL